MAKEYFQDILPPNDGPKKNPVATPQPVYDEAPDPLDRTDEAVSRGIRSIQPARPRPITRTPPARPLHADMSQNDDVPITAQSRSRASRWWLWAIAGTAVIALVIVALLSVRLTTVTITPKSRTITLSETLFVAAPQAAPVPGVPLTYTVQSFDIEDSEIVAAQGTRRVEAKATGSITVYNEYATTPVKLIKNTRFETPDGLVFRAPADVVVPGKSGATPGQVKITVVADAPGERYNVGPVTRFTLPGLKSGDMYTKVYARSTQPMAGGIVGDEPATAPGALTSAISAVRARLTAKAQETVLAQSGAEETTVFPTLAQISFVALPSTTESSSTVRIHQKAHVEVPVFSRDELAATVAKSQSEDVQSGAVRLIPGEGFDARTASSTALSYGVEPIPFVLSGGAQIVWNIDNTALKAALAGREGGAFQTIVDGFAGIQEARARIQPPWKKDFPTNPERIKIVIGEVSSQ